MVAASPTTHHRCLIGPYELLAGTLADQQDLDPEFGVFFLFLGQRLALRALFSPGFMPSCAGLAM